MIENLPAHYSSHVWRRRIELGLHQSVVAERACISVGYLGRIENLKANPSPRVIAALASALRCTEDYLLCKTFDPHESLDK